MHLTTPYFLQFITLLLLSCCSLNASAQWRKLLNIDSKQDTTKTAENQNSSLKHDEINSGIKQALSQGLDRSIQTLSIKDGFLKNQTVKILLPPQAQRAEKTLRSVGLGSLADDLITNLNRAAEAAVGEAAPVFANALKQLTIQDASRILFSGQEDAATDFFKRMTTEELTRRFSPIVSKNLSRFNVSKYWTDVVTRYNQIPLVDEKVDADLEAYVTEKAIAGLFTQVAEEELKIRNNLGGSRTTPLLKKVFGETDKQ